MLKLLGYEFMETKYKHLMTTTFKKSKIRQMFFLFVNSRVSRYNYYS